MDQLQLYNSRLIKVNTEYISQNYPQIHIQDLLEYAGIKPYALEDKGYWLNQRLVD